MSEGSYADLERSRVRRLPERGSRERALVHAILDEGLIGHVGFASERGPVVIPMLYARDGERLYLHGSPASRLMRTLSRGVPVCITVTHVDGLVLARSAFHHSVNYRSVTVFGRARALLDDADKLAALRAFTERLYPGRWDEVRVPNATELKATQVLSLPLDETVAKVRTGPPLDDAEDMGRPVWAGVVPLEMVARVPIADAELLPGTSLRASSFPPGAAWCPRS